MGAARVRIVFGGVVLFCLASMVAAQAAEAPRSEWKIGSPIVTYWAGPGFPSGGVALTDASARLLAEGGWNLVWCQENTLPVVER
ncbi:MAG TPA: hypothetical protein VK689_16310, partial [Armatimonadota bacterium]|nr:hypothetical protein [Armatimonadota bacterium]